MVSPTHLPVAYLPGARGDSSLWKPIAERLALRRTPILIDYPGFGRAPKVASVTSMSSLCRFIAESLPAQCDLVAHSMGGVIALTIALEYPERIRKMVLVATSGGVDVAKLGGLDWRPTFRELRPEVPSWFVDDRSNVTERLKEICIPTLVIYGDDDLIAPVSVGQFLVERLAAARLEIIPRGTHDLEEEHPDLVASLIEAHLRK